MDLATFESELKKELSSIRFISGIEIIHRTPISLYALISIDKSFCLKIFYNHLYNILSFSLISNNQRIWGLDKDNRIGWHIHPLDNPDYHEKIEEMNLAEIISKVHGILKDMIDKE